MRLLLLSLFCTAALSQTVNIPLQITVTPTRVTVSVSGQSTTLPVPQPTCGPLPPTSTQVIACPSGTAGSWVQTTSYVAAAYPTCSTKNISPTSAPAGSCVAVTPPPINAATVYNNGTINWPFNMSYGATVNYQDTVGTPGGIDAAITITGSNGGGWQPGFSIPCQNGGTNCFDTSPYGFFVFSYKPTQANTSFIMAWHKPGDVSNGNAGLSIAQYCSNPAVGTWGNCKVPLSAFGFSSPVVSKFTLQVNNPTVFYVNGVGFSAT